MPEPINIRRYEVELKKALAAEDFESLTALDVNIREDIERVVGVSSGAGKGSVASLKAELDSLESLYGELVLALEGKRGGYASELGKLQLDKKGVTAYRKAE
jgi:hypothetical protein